MINVQIDIEPKQEYEPLYTQKARYKDLWGGRGRGGSHEATLYALYRLTSPIYTRVAIIRKIFRDLKSSLWQDLKDRIEETGTHGFKLNDQDLSGYHTLTGNYVKGFGVKAEKGRTAKLKSLAGYNLIIIEEFDELTEDEFDTIDDSLRTVKGEPPEIVRVYNPPGRLHWVWRRHYNLLESGIEGYWRATPKADQDLLSIFGTYEDNYQNLAPSTLAKWLAYEKTRPEYFHTMIMGLISEGQRGRVYKGWRPISNEDFEAVDARSVYGLDFGWSESPMSLSQYKLVKNRVYHRNHIYEPMTLKQLAIRLCKLGLTKSDLIVADSEDPVSINKLRSGWRASELDPGEAEKYPQLLKGFYVVGSIKGPGSVNYGISIVQEREVHVTEDSVNTWEEYYNYRWALDVNKNPTNTPEDEYNHIMDEMRYVIGGKGRVF